jgi:L-alanine-DL-glutamate epimerase-like enolase superfamily enzyme
MSLPTDIQIVATELYFLPVKTRVPLKFGTEALTSVTCARAKVTVQDASGARAIGWGETPLSVQWVWPGELPYEPRHEALKGFCVSLAEALSQTGLSGHPVEIGYDFIEDHLHPLADTFNKTSAAGGDLPYLAALVCYSLFDIATHDAFGRLLDKDIYDTYGAEYFSRDLAAMLTPADGADVSFEGQHIADYLVDDAPSRLRAWHLVGGLDPLTDDDLTGDEPDDGYPVTLPQWIETDSLACLKIKLRGNDEDWDYERFVRVGQIAAQRGVEWLSADFNCTVTDPDYVNRILDKLRDLHPALYGSILYVEQPFPHDLEANRIDVHSVSARKPLFLDESAHDWKFVKLGRSLGWNGVALKTCKTQTGALLSLCWAKAHGMPLMVQDLTNPMLAQIPHLRLAAHAGTIMGVETNAMQFYPEASNTEAALHTGMYQRRQGIVDLSTILGPGFGYREDEIHRDLPEPTVGFEA